MTAGMADIIAAHSHVGVDPESWNLGAQARWYCHGCGALENNPHPDTTKPIWHGVHLTEELTKAGYGNVQEAKAEALREAAEVFGSGTWSDVYLIADVEDDAGAARATADWLCERAAALTPDPLAAALADPEGHALVKAIHDRKVGG